MPPYGSQEFREALEKQPVVRAGAQALLDCPSGTLNFAHVAVSRHNVEGSREQGLADTRKLIVPVYVADYQTPRLMAVDDTAQRAQDRGLSAVERLVCGVEADVARVGVKERQALNKEEIHTERCVSVMLKDGSLDRFGHECGRSGGGR